MSDALAAMGAGPETPIGVAARTVGAVHGANADTIEALQRAGTTTLERARHGP